MNKDKLKYTERKHIYELLFGGEEKNRSYSKCPEPRKGVIDTNKSLCDSCTNNGCILQSGIIRNHCDFYKTESEVY